jgi:hypothetical protein
MTKQILTTVVVGALFAVTGCAGPEPGSPTEPSFAQMPADGNGNKLIIPRVFEGEVDCGAGATIHVQESGWIQVVLLGQANNRNVEVSTANFVVTFTNATGETLAWRDVGGGLLYVDDDGSLILVLTGRVGGIGVIGRAVLKIIDTAPGFEVLVVTGKEFGSVSDHEFGAIFAIACDALT